MYRIMRNNTCHFFCEICREEIIVAIHDRISLIDDATPPATDTVRNGQNAVLSVHPVKTDSSGLKIEWEVNGTLSATSSESLSLCDAGLHLPAH